MREERPLDDLPELLSEHRADLAGGWDFRTENLDAALALASELVQALLPSVGLGLVDEIAVNGYQVQWDGDGLVVPE